MSRSNPRTQNPCQKFIDFKSDKGYFSYYDKETEKEVVIPTPFYFIVLDELSTISGYNKKHDCGIYSNEVHRLKDEILRVKTFKGGESITGLYADVRDSIIALGGKFTKSVYAMLIIPEKEPELVNFKFRGAAFSAWIEKKMNTDNCTVGVVDFKEEKNGNTIYNVPVLHAYKLDPALNQLATEMDVILQEYLKEYKSQQPEKEIIKAEAEVIESNGKYISSSQKDNLINKSRLTKEEEPDDLPF